MVDDAVSVTKEEAKETGGDDGLKEGGDGKLGGLHSGIGRDVWGGLEGIVAV